MGTLLNFQTIVKYQCLSLPALTCTVCLLLGATPQSEAASIGICTVTMPVDAGMRSQIFYSQSGEQQQLVLSDSELDGMLCASIQVPQTLEAIAWASLLPGRSDLAPDRVTLQGSFAPGDTSVSEIIANTAAPVIAVATAPPQVPNPLPEYDALVFGIEERASWLDGERLQCREGQNVAGVQLKHRAELPRNEQLYLLSSGAGEFQLMIADADRMEREAALELGALTAASDSPGVLARFDLPPNNAPWVALTILCPMTAATLHVDSIDFHPAMDEQVPERSAWVWQPAVWQQDPAFFWRLQALEGIQEFFITVPVNASGEVSNASQLRQFIREASAREVRIWAVIGDRNDVLEENRGLLRTRVSAYRRFNDRAPEEERLAGAQLDIEPYLLPGHNLATSLWRDRYLQTISAATDVAYNLAIDLVMPVWWGNHPAWGREFLSQLDAPNLSITVMNYRTDARRLHAGAIPFLNWGSEKQRRVRMALETGSLDDETQRVYRANDSEGQLWQLQIDSTPILVLFNTAQNGLDGMAYGMSDEREFSASNLTFGGDQQSLNAIADQLNQTWQHWPGYAGIALHGLDEIYAER